ncbi:MAG: ATP-grasp domain-containing protein, partial [Spirochaetales bacterium]
LDKVVQELFQSPHRVHRILLEQAIRFEKEYYLSFTMDPKEAKALLIASAEGGIEIEQVAAATPEKVLQYAVDLDAGLLPFHTRALAYDLNLSSEVAKGFAGIVQSLWKVFRDYDAELAEINPLFLTPENQWIAGDGKVSIDDNSLFRHPEMEPDRDYFDSEIAYEAYKEGIPYLQFAGDISLMCAGAGLTTTVYDLIQYEGGTVANYLEFGGPNYRKGVRAMELCLKNKPKVVLIVTFGTIARADVMAQGIVEAVGKLKPTCPIVTCIRGTGEEEAKQILKSAGIEPLFDTEEAVRIAVKYCRQLGEKA